MPEATRLKYEPPQSVADAQRQRADLLDDIGSIGTQLKDPARANDPVWRTSALRALRAREGVLRRLNVWLSENARHSAAPQEVIKAAYKILTELRDDPKDGVEFSDTDLAAIDELGKYT